MGFFTVAEMKKTCGIKKDINQLQSDCLKCKLYKDSTHPKMEYSGKGEKGILIIGEYSNEEDDIYGTQFGGEEGDILKDVLRPHGISLNKDCWKINAIRCCPPPGKLPTQTQIKCCYPHIEKIIKTLKPKTIFLMGTLAINSLFGTNFSNREVALWRKYCIPDEKFKCNIIPLYHPSHISKKWNDKNLQKLFERDIKFAVHCLKRPYIPREDYEGRVKVLTTFDKVTKLLKRILRRKQRILFDYETTGLKPYHAGHKIVSIGVATSAKKAYAFPYDYKTHWTKNEFTEIKRLWRKILRHKKIEKMAQNTKFETIWSRKFFNAKPTWFFDTMMAEHCFPKEVEFLTESGWKSCSKIKHHDSVAQMNMKTKEITYANPLKLIKKQDTLIYLKNKTMEFCCTPDHDIIRTFSSGKLEKIKAKDVIKKYESNFLGAGKIKTGKIHNKEKLELYAAILTDGAILYKKRNNSAYGFRFSFKKERKITKVINILNKNKIKYSQRIRKDGATSITAYVSKITREFLTLFPNKLLSFTFANSMNLEETKFFIEQFNFFDGAYTVTKKRPNLLYISQAKPQNIDVLQCMFSRVGYRSNSRTKEVNTVYGKGTQTLLNGNTKDYFITQFKNATINKTDKLSDVYCATMPEGTLITRYNGCVLIMGNCLDNRSKSTGLKFQTFVHYGVRPYDEVIKPFLKSGSGEFNNIEKAPFKELLIYNGLDCVFAWMRFEDQIRKLTQRKRLLSAYNFFMQGLDVMGNIQHNGICMNTKYYKLAKRKLIKKIAKRKKYLESGREARAFQKKFNRPIKITSNQDLGKLFYEVLGKPPVLTEKGNYKTDAATLESLNLPWVKKLLEMKKYEKAKGTYLGQFAREICNDKMHPFFDLHIPVTYRGSSSKPNFQNLPKRNPEIGKIVRKGIIPSPGCVLCEADFSGAEVITSATYHKDKQFIHDITIGDMHRDLAIELWKLPKWMLDKKDKRWKTKEQLQAIKDIRFFAKNNWTFAQFYGDWYGTCGRLLWESCIDADLKLPTGQPLREWLEGVGIYELGEIDRYEGPTPGSFFEHCKNVETKMWKERFPQYTEWKQEIIEFYQDYGYIENHFGFRFINYMDRKQCTNFPIQSASFHLLVHTLIKVQAFIKKHKLKTLLVGQIHDSILADSPKNEIDFYIKGVNKIVADLKNDFKWLIIPMEIDVELSKLREHGGNFAEMREFSIKEIENEKHKKYLTNS